MRVVLDTNVLISALMAEGGFPGQALNLWRAGNFTLLSCQAQFDEVRATLQKPAVAIRIRAQDAGKLINNLKHFAEDVGPLPIVRRSPDPDDNFLLATAEAGRADYLVTGDKDGLLALQKHAGTRIIAARSFVALFD